MSATTPKSKRLDPLIEHAEAREDAAAREFAEKQRALAASEQRLAELTRYAAEYAAAPSGSTAPALLANRAAFRARVDEAVGLQRDAVQRTREQCEVQRARLLIASRDAQVLEKLAASHRAAEAKVDERRAQKQLDDLAARGHIERMKGPK